MAKISRGKETIKRMFAYAQNTCRDESVGPMTGLQGSVLSCIRGGFFLLAEYCCALQTLLQEGIL